MSAAERAEDVERRLVDLQAPRLAELKLPEQFLLPDYERSIANVPATLAAALGVELPGALSPLPATWWVDLTAGVRRVVWIILDAVGWFRFRNLVEANGSSLYNRLAQVGRLYPITSIFPSTTTSALTSLWTGYAAGRHGLVGHDIYMPSLGMVVDTLGLSPAGEPRNECLVGHGLVPEELVLVPGLAQVLAEQGVTTRALIQRGFVNSGLSRLQFRGVEEVVGCISWPDLCTVLASMAARPTDEPLLLVAYWAHIDTIGHYRGPNSRSWLAEMHSLAYSLQEAFLSELTPVDRQGTLLVLTADHGQIATGRESVIHLADHPKLQNCLWMPPTGGPRAAYLTALPGRLEDLRKYVGEHLAHQFAWLDTKVALEAGFLGPGDVPSLARRRLGDLILLGRQDYMLEQRERDHPLLGSHGGMSASEMLVPFLFARLD